MTKIRLPPPRKLTAMSVEEALLLRRSVRSFLYDPLTLDELSLLLWAAGGRVGKEENRRTAPSAGATYPLLILCFVGPNSIVGGQRIDAGVYRYEWKDHSLEMIIEGDRRKELARAALGQRFIYEAPISIAIFADYSKTTRYYGERGYRYVHMEAGHVGENIYLMATALNLGTVAVGAFDDEEVMRITGINELPLYIFPIGRPRLNERRTLEADEMLMQK
ncbi:MAG: SagB/ThcOx family dehydrogenase [Fervidicoccaceae archaeon]